MWQSRRTRIIQQSIRRSFHFRHFRISIHQFITRSCQHRGRPCVSNYRENCTDDVLRCIHRWLVCTLYIHGAHMQKETFIMKVKEILSHSLLNAIYLVFILFFKQTKAKLFTYLSVVLLHKGFITCMLLFLTTFKDLLSERAELTGVSFSSYLLGQYCWKYNYQSHNEPEINYILSETDCDRIFSKAATKHPGLFDNTVYHKSLCSAVK